MATLTLWVVVLAVGALNYLSRLSFIAFFARRDMPPMLARALRFVPAAMLTALVVPMIVTPTTMGPAGETMPRVIAALIAAAVALATRKEMATIVVGMAALWAQKALL
jgi:branched-subunit amino acid transport protein